MQAYPAPGFGSARSCAQHLAPQLVAGETFYYSNAGHGTAMFSNPDLSTRLLGWLGVKLGEGKG